MNTGRPITFDIKEMLILRYKGWTTVALGLRYGRDHTTITHHCQKYGVIPFAPPKNIIIKGKIIIEAKKPLPPVGPQPKYAHLFDEAVNPGKPYALLLKQALERPIERAYFKLMGNAYHTPKKSR